ncbi:MAG TPA: hypothetical protein VIH74_06680 [Candidatus Acidoferrum sp.]|jgi:hypothetical protein
MPLNDRDQNFEKALAGGLRSSNAAPSNDCVDAETLAAYHDRLLDPEEMAQRKAHIASCERCQEILAQLEATDGIAVEADRDLLLDQVVLELPETEPASGAKQPPPPTEAAAEAPATLAAETSPQPELPVEVGANVEHDPELILDPKLLHDPELVPASAAAPSSEPSRVPAAAPIPVAAARMTPAASQTITFRPPRQDRPKMVRFVALFGAIAAALILWFVYRDQSKESEIALNRPATKIELPPQSPASPPQTADRIETPLSASNSANSPAAAAPAAQQQQALSKTPTDSAANALDEGKTALDAAKALEQKSRKDAASQPPTFISGRDDSGAAAPLNSARNAPHTAPKSLGLNALKNASTASPVDKAIADAKAVLQPAGNSSSGIPPTPPPARTKMNPGVVTESVTVSAASTQLSEVSPSASSDTLSKPATGRIAAALTPLSVPAPSGKTIWRIGQAGVIQRSTDSGTTWSIQPSGVVTDLIAGSAYSDQVCWLVGRNGTVLRTTNGGATWQKLTSPSNVDLLAVFSINADSATVTDAAGRAFETTTAGAHWTRTTLQN